MPPLAKKQGAKKIMPNEEKEIEKSEEDKVVTEKGQQFEEEKSQKDEFEKEEEFVPSGKYNAAVRKQRELELEKRELERKLAEGNIEPEKKKVEEDEDDDFFEEEKKKKEIDLEVIEPISKEVKELREKLERREAEDKKTQRTAFFNEHPEYLKDSEKWQELLDELDNFNPNSKDSYFKQLNKAHRIISGDNSNNSAIEKKKAEMAAEMAGKQDDAKKTQQNSGLDERSLRLAKKMPRGYEFKARE